jgi:6-phosphogluconate dehydrogenase
VNRHCRLSRDLADIAEVWRRGSVISSWLLDLTAMALAEDSTLANFGTPRWRRQGQIG